MTVHTLVTALPDPSTRPASSSTASTTSAPPPPWRAWPRAHWPGLLDGLPPSLAHHPEDPEFQFEEFFDATVCVWREKNAPTWNCGPVTFTADESAGADRLFTLLTDGTPDTYVAYAEDYFERPIDHTAVATVQSGAPSPAGQ